MVLCTYKAAPEELRTLMYTQVNFQNLTKPFTHSMMFLIKPPPTSVVLNIVTEPSKFH